MVNRAVVLGVLCLGGPGLRVDAAVPAVEGPGAVVTQPAAPIRLPAGNLVRVFPRPELAAAHGREITSIVTSDQTPPTKAFVGRLLSIDERSLTLQIKEAPDPITLPLDGIAGIHAQQRQSYVREGGILGLILGAAFGIYSGAVLNAMAEDDHNYFPVAMGLSSGLGTLLGAGVGAAFPKKVWRPVRAERVRVSLRPCGRRGAGVALALAF